MIAGTNSRYLHFQLSLITLFERCLRRRTLAARLRVMNPECLLRSADIMAAVAVVLRIQGA